MRSDRVFDDLARALAEPMPRRRALRLIGGALATAAAPALLAPRKASARSAACPGPGACAPGQTYAEFPVLEGCMVACCDPGYSPCVGRYGSKCCFPNEVCTDPNIAKCECAPQYLCGPACCQPGQRCEAAVCVADCPPGVTACGGKCCKSGEKCCPSTATAPSRCYDPETKCCSPIAGVIPKTPIKKVEWCPERVPKQGHKPKANGCGPEGGQGGVDLVPDVPLGLIDFTPACNYHDICYETCRTPKAKCDRNFRRLMERACKKKYTAGARRQLCVSFAATYYTAVAKLGDDAYEVAQKAACAKCCP
jgi:hypothetical protein